MSLKKYLKDHRLHLLLGLLAEGVVEAVLWLFASPVALTGICFFLADREYRSDFWIRFPEKKKIL